MRLGGYAVIVDGGTGKTTEFDTVMCCHCNGIVSVQAGTPIADLGGFCMSCMRNTCKRCNQDGRCRPFMKLVDQMEARGRLLAQMG